MVPKPRREGGEVVVMNLGCWVKLFSQPRRQGCKLVVVKVEEVDSLTPIRESHEVVPTQVKFGQIDKRSC